MLDFTDAEKRVADVIPTEFWTDHEDKDGENVLVDFVRWQKIGNPNHKGEERVSRVKRHQPDIWEALKPYYEAWKKNEEAPVNGTPIANWPPITKRLAEVMKTNGFRSVEDLAKATDSDLGRIGMGAMALRDKAREFVALKVDTKTAGTIDSLKKTIERLENEIVFLKEKNDALASRETNETKSPKRRGRPPRVKENEPTDNN